MKKRIIALLLVLALVTVSGVGCGQTQSETPGEAPEVESANTEGSVEQKEELQVNPKVKEAEKVLMSQLEPLPELKKDVKIGALVISLTNPFWVGMKEAYEAAAAELGITVEVFAGSTEGDKQAQLDALDAMVVKDYDAIILSPIEPFNLQPGILRANENGIPIINLGPGVDVASLEERGGHLDGRIAVDFVEQGRKVAEDMLKYMKGSKKVAIIQGIIGAGQSEGRTQGAKEVFEATEGVELVSIQPADWDRNKAYSVAQDLIQAHPDLNGIFACNDVMALAAAEALEAEGKLDEVVIYGVDFTEEAREAIKAGRMSGSIAYPCSVYAKAALILAAKVAEGQKVQPVYAPLEVVNVDNVHEFEGWK
ncbi:MAG: substrate-binding domain-containing protein [Zhaonellaceae bacterium]|jgi:ABC-type sugar transport system substrate-binding protein